MIPCFLARGTNLLVFVRHPGSRHDLFLQTYREQKSICETKAGVSVVAGPHNVWLSRVPLLLFFSLFVFCVQRRRQSDRQPLDIRLVWVSTMCVLEFLALVVDAVYYIFALHNNTCTLCVCLCYAPWSQDSSRVSFFAGFSRNRNIIAKKSALCQHKSSSFAFYFSADRFWITLSLREFFKFKI